ncbi:MAG: hypothetical protein ACLT8E_04945 [Akkermansia sp.]
MTALERVLEQIGAVSLLVCGSTSGQHLLGAYPCRGVHQALGQKNTTLSIYLADVCQPHRRAGATFYVLWHNFECLAVVPGVRKSAERLT